MRHGTFMTPLEAPDLDEPTPDFTARTPGEEPIPGYRLLEPLGRGGFGEVWKCEAPGGLHKAIKFVHGSLDALHGSDESAEEERRAIERVKAIRHPFLLSIERVECIGGDLVIVLELADKSLQALLGEHRDAGRAGVPRDELLVYMREAAEALDVLNVQHSLLHLDVKPHNLFLLGGHVKVGDFGLVCTVDANSASGAGPLHLDSVTPLYAAPELFLGNSSRFSDQYSLAIVYQELLTGTLPFQGKSVRQLMIQHMKEEPELSVLHTFDQATVARALSKDPEARFPSCSAFVRALAPSRALAASPRPPSLSAFSASANETASMPSIAPPTEGVAGHQLLNAVACTPLSEVWQALDANGQPREVRILFGFTRSDARAEAAALTRWQALQHPILASADIVQQSPGRLVISAPMHEKSLRERFQECLTQGLPGIPRDELLGYLRELANGLTWLFRERGLHHLLLNPRNLFVDGSRLQVADFGLAQLLWLPAGQDVFQINANYAAPELQLKQFNPRSDQYSLALIYYDLLSAGLHRSRRFRRSPGARTAESLDLDRLTDADRTIVHRALEPDPGHRWDSILAFVQALDAADSSKATTPVAAAAPEEARAPASGAVGASRRPDPPPTGRLETTISCSLPRGVLELRLDGFRRQWDGQMLSQENDCVAFVVKTPRSFWQRWLGRRPGLEVRLEIARVSPDDSPAGEITVHIEPRELGRSEGAEALQVIGLLLLESLRNNLQVTPRRRGQERLLWPYEFEVRPVFADGRFGEAIRCQGNDISMSGIGFRSPRELPSTQISLHLPRTPQSPAVEVTGRVVRSRQREDHWWDVGAVLLAPVPRARQ
jgi:serine/threonine protein kinase